MNFKHFKTNDGTIFTSKPYRYSALFGVVFFAILFSSQLREGFTMNNVWMPLLFFVGIFVNLYQFGARVSINKKTRKLTTSNWGLFKKKYSGEDLQQFSTLKHLYYGLFPNGTDINASFTNQSKEVTLLPRVGKKRVSKIITELEQLVNI